MVGVDHLSPLPALPSIKMALGEAGVTRASLSQEATPSRSAGATGTAPLRRPWDLGREKARPRGAQTGCSGTRRGTKEWPGKVGAGGGRGEGPRISRRP